MGGFLEMVGMLLGKILWLVEGILDNWVNVVGANILNWSLTSAGTAVTAEISDLIEKILQLIEDVLETWFGVYPY